MRKRSLVNTSAENKIILGVSLFLGFIFDYFFYAKVPGIAFPLYVFLIITGFFALAALFGKKINKEVFFLLIPLFFLSAMVFIRSSFLLTFLNIIASLLLLLLLAETFFGKKLKNFLIDDYLKIFFLPIKFIRPLSQTLANLFSPGKNQEQKVFLAVVKGALISIPILFVFILLFSSADLVFKKYFARLITLNISPEIVLRAILILGATLICLGAYSYLFRQTISQKKGENKRLLGYIETSTLLFLVNALFFLFILIQAAYLFGGQSNISSQGFTYAEYARRGFFELIAVAVISLLLLLTTEKYTRNNHAPAFKILSAILIVQVILIMASAFIRLSLYEEAYGLTTLRLYSHAFIILLAVIFGFLFYKICKGREEDYFAFRTFLTLLFFLIAMNFLDPDAFIARCNIKRFASTGKIDIGYLSRLSDDAIPDIIESLDQLDESSKKSLVYELSQRAKKNSSPSLSSWQSLNLSRLRAKKLLNTKIGDLRQYQNSRLAQPEE